MKHKHTRGLSMLLAGAMLCALYTSALAADAATVDAAIADTAAYVYEKVETPQVGSIGGEWAVLGLARSGYDVPEEYYQDYYATVETYVKACDGVLHTKKYTEYARVIVALSAIGKDARNVAGYDLTVALGDYENTIWQGLNGPIWALIALDSRDYPMPQNSAAQTQATRQMYVARILACQRSDGGWSLLGGAGDSGDGVCDPDITGMALQALAKYQDQPAVKQATDDALACMSKQQNERGGFCSWGEENVEGCAQMLVGLCELGIPLEDARFVKNGKTLADNLLSFYQKGGGFAHTAATGSNQMATEQGFCALVALQRAEDGANSLYSMGDAITVSGGDQQGGTGLKGKDPALVPISAPGTTFGDIALSPNVAAIEALAARAIINGKDGGVFDPDGQMTRSEFATIVVKALGLTPGKIDQFTDVPSGSWYGGYVGAAYTHGIVTGSSATTFSPGGTITREEAATMVARAAKLGGMDTQLTAGATRNMLSQFPDYITTSEWARTALAFCYSEDILDQNDAGIEPQKAITRGEIAQILFNMLGRANLL